MNTKRSRKILCAVVLSIGVSVGLFAILTIAESKMKVEEIPPIPQQIVTDVVSRDLDLLKVTSEWPKSLTVENISDKEVSGFEIMIWAANDDGGPGEILRWGAHPKQTPLFKAKEAVTLPIKPETVKEFQANGKPFLYVEVYRVWVNNDSKFMYAEGALLQQDANNPRHYTVIRDAKGRSKHQHHHAVSTVTPHITHSVRPPFPLGCCNRELFDSVTFDCDVADPCDPGLKCQNTNYAFTFCNNCCTALQVTTQISCYSVSFQCFPPVNCSEKRSITHSNPCNCCNC